MEEERNIEESANAFLESFFDATYYNNEILFNNMQKIYELVMFLYYNMKKLDIESPDLINGSRKDFAEKSKLIEGFYKNINVDFKMDYITRNGVLNILSTNNPEEATYNQIYSGSNSYITIKETHNDPITKKEKIIYSARHKAINVHNNDLLNDSIIWVHEISHYKNQPLEKRGQVNDILTELIAFTEELIYTDYLSQIGYEEEAKMFMIEEYNNLAQFIVKSYYVLRIALLYLLRFKVSKEDYNILYNEDKKYYKSLKIFDEEKNENQNIIFLLLYYSVGIISFYSYIEYKKDPNFLDKLKKLNKKIMTDISLEEALKIIDIELNQESLNKILENINIFRDSLIKEKTKKKILN